MNAHAAMNDDTLHEDEVPFGQTAAEAKIAELAKLSALEYELSREDAAESLGVRVSKLDQFVQAARPADADAEDAPTDPFDMVEAWPEPVDGAGLLHELQQTVERFCVLPEHTAPLMAAWVLHAWAHDASDISPVLAFVSPEKRCGKTTALSVIGALTPKTMHAVNISTSVLFRVIEKFCPTVLIDEADTFLEANDELRGVLNGGHNRLSAYVWRTVGDDFEPRRFRVWAPKCMAMIGKLPDTLEDRALVVHLRRKQEGETVERFRADRLHEFLHLRRKAARWAEDNALRLRDMDPMVPQELNDRAQDNARAICAIADAAGGAWPKAIRDALVGAAAQVDDEPQSAGVLLLRDVAEVFDAKGIASISSTGLCTALCELEESPWNEWRGGRPISTRGIAKLLKPYGIEPKRDRHHRYYRRMDFTDAFKRYLSEGVKNSVTSYTSVMPGHNLLEKNGNPYDAYSSRDTCKRHTTDADQEWEGEI